MVGRSNRLPSDISMGMYAKLAPIMTGRPEPQYLWTGNTWISVATADMSSAAWIRIIWSSRLAPVTPATMMAGVTQPTIMATTCWSARGSVWDILGIPFKSKTEAFLFSFISRSSLYIQKFFHSRVGLRYDLFLFHIDETALLYHDLPVHNRVIHSTFESDAGQQ